MRSRERMLPTEILEVLAPAWLPDLIAARDALAARIVRAKRDANPLYVDLDDAPDVG